MDFDDLGGLVGATPGTGAGESASARQEKRSRAQAQTGRVLPQREYRIPKLRAMDADVRLRAEHIDAGRLPLQNMTAHLVLTDGLLTLDPLDFGAAGGVLDSRIVLDAREAPIATSLDVRARSLDLPQLFPNVKTPGIGRIGGHVVLHGRGNSVAAMLGGAQGDVAVVMGEGKLSNLLLELAGLDIAEALKFLLGKDKMVPVRCAYADFGVEAGVLTTRAFALDTTDTVLLGEGNVDLGREKLALKLKPRPKDMSPLSIRSPLIIGGTLKNPRVTPDPGPLTLRAAAAAALFAITPPAALLALIETGPGKDTDCGASIAKP
jgi:uncharacterized protein involved in outer membrane biogenesis